MKLESRFTFSKTRALFFALLCMLLLNQLNVQAGQALRRPISPQQPMWLVHIDTWNYADPQKIINLIPKDIRPFVVMNISLSISHNTTTHQFQVAEYGYSIAKSWLKVCAENRMWAVVQPSSGGFCQFSDFDLSVYEEFFREFPNFLGFNYAEQFWGYDDPNDPLSAKWGDRMSHFANLLKLTNKYGGYLTVSWCGNQWGPNINPIGMMKRSPAFAAACRDYTENYILCEKYTTTSYISDRESVCLGAYLSGYSGQYGIRYDDTGWTNKVVGTGRDTLFTMATALAPHLEHAMLTGQTVIDGPELIWTQCFRESGNTQTPDGYSRRNWATFNQFDNVNIDLFRKIVDGTVRIPTRKEVIDRTKLVIVNDVNNSNNNETYSAPQTLFEGLYRMDNDGNYENNKMLFKKTGRYPTIPTVFQLDDTDAKSFLYKVNRSAYSTRWPSIASKVTEFNTLFPQEYTGTAYAGRHENGWVLYNPLQTGARASSSIPFKYNTCDRIDVSFAMYSTAIMKEYDNKLVFYLNNYDNVINTALKNDTIRIYGSTLEPTYTYKDRAKHTASIVSKTWVDGVFSLVVQHNGALDLTINCAGTATGRLTAFTPSVIVTPTLPPYYTGPLQYESECADAKNTSSRVTGGQNGSVRNYSGQGYMVYGANTAASLRDTVTVLRKGVYQLGIRYSAATANVSSINLFVNGVRVATPLFEKTPSKSDWATYTRQVQLKQGANSIMLTSLSTVSSRDIIFDYISVSSGNASTVYNFESDVAGTAAQNPAAQFVKVKSGTAGVVTYSSGTETTGKGLRAYSNGTLNGTGLADLELFPTEATDYHVIWKETTGSTGGKKAVLLRATGAYGACVYADSLKKGYLFATETNVDRTVTLTSSVASESGLTLKKSYVSTFAVQPGQPCWYRATALGTSLVFECSTDSLNWEGAETTSYTDASYSLGATQFVWGFGTPSDDWVVDNIQYGSKVISLSKFAMTGLGYAVQAGPGVAQTLTVAAKDLTNSLQLVAPNNFELSFTAGTGYANTLQITTNSGAVPQTTVYVRAKVGLKVNKYTGNVRVLSEGFPEQRVAVSADVVPSSVTKMYNFNNDAASTDATYPPALNASIGLGNSATAGVVAYTPTQGVVSNMLKPYSSPDRNASGVINLNAFSRRSTDYSVTWKQVLTNAGTDYKVGMLLRGDSTKIGDATTGYVQGIMHGYLFIVYSKASGGSEFRIYKTSTASTSSMSALTNYGVSTLTPTTGQPMWYRASATGSTSVALKFEYSTDSVTWTSAATYTDGGSPLTAGATQIVWGLGAGNVNFCLDNITFKGMETALKASTDLAVSDNQLTGFTYQENDGPSTSKQLYVSGNLLTNSVLVTAPANYEVSLSASTGFASSLTLTQTGGVLAQVPLYVRLISGLTANSYTGDLTVASLNASSVVVALSGVVTPITSVIQPETSATVVSEEYFTVTGQRIRSKNGYRGILLVKRFMSDGSIDVVKELFE